MLGFVTEPMQTKKTTGINQVCDYHGIITTTNGDRYIDIAVERKEISDLYGTLIPEDNRARFYREIERFNTDERFNKMVIIVEGTLSDFIMYQPEFNGDEFDYGRRFDVKKNATINEKKITVLADTMVAGVQILFCDNPTLAAQMCGRMFRESVKKEYYKILRLRQKRLNTFRTDDDTQV
jgi:ERCC4-type nuclease